MSAFESRTEVWREVGLGSEHRYGQKSWQASAAPMTRTRRFPNPGPTGTGRATAARPTGAH